MTDVVAFTEEMTTAGVDWQALAGEWAAMVYGLEHGRLTSPRRQRRLPDAWRR
jgi:hypothetical protein